MTRTVFENDFCHSVTYSGGQPLRTSPFRRTLLNSSSLITGLALGLSLALPAGVARADSFIPTLAGGSGGSNNTAAAIGAGADGTQSGYVGGSGGSAGSTGGAGGNGALGSGQIASDGGGAGGATPGAAGGAGATFLVGGGGGGGGAHGYVGTALPGSVLTGGAGGAGGGGGDPTPGNHNSGSGGGGGGGGFAAVVEGNGALGTLAGSLTGGAGGAGGDTTTYGYAYGGKGGAGGAGLYLSSTADTSLTITGTVQGGLGGNGGQGSPYGNGSSGAGGSGIYGVNNGGITTLTLADTARVLGGNAGSVITGAVAGTGGVGIAGENLDVILAAGSMVSAGQTSDTISPRYAIQFTGGTNSLELQGNGGTSGQTYAAMDGGVLGAGETTLKLTGAGGTFDLDLLNPEEGFSNFTGVAVNTTGSWIVSGAAADTSPWLVAAGTLSNGPTGATLGGDTVVVGGAHLSAQAVPDASAFTINGDLSLLSNTSALDVTLGAPSSIPLVTVNGDLSLNGILNIYDSGSVTPGTYTLFGYTGDYSGTGLTVGTTFDPDLRYAISTATPNLVTLAVGINGLYWNGTTIAGDGIVVGGTGTWTALLGTTNWIDPTNTFYVASNPGMPALFSGTAGTVTVDKTDGAISAQGLRFETTGYTLTGATVGDTLMLNTITGIPRVTVVGDSTLATIALPLTGTQGIEKAGTGKLILTGANTYTGGTTLTAGTLQLGDGTTTGSVVGNITNNAALVFNPAGLDASYAGVISGSGTVTKSGAGSLNLSGNSSYTGNTSVTGGVLRVSGNDALGGTAAGTTVSSGATLGLYGNGLTIAEPLTLSGSGLNNVGALASYRGDSLSAGTNTVSGSITLAANASIVNAGGAGDALNLKGNITGDDKSLYLSSIPTATNTVSGQISTGEGSVEILSGSWAFTNKNTYTGSTIISSGATLSIKDVSFNRVYGDVLNSGTLILGGNVTAFDGSISGAGDIEISTDSSQFVSSFFTASNSYTGETRIKNGYLEILTAGSLGSADSGTIVSSGGFLSVYLPTDTMHTMEEPLTISGHGNSASSAAVIFGGGKLVFKGPITLADDAVIFARGDVSDSLDLQGRITGSGKNLTLEGSWFGSGVQRVSGEVALGTGGVAIKGGEWIFSGNSSYTGFTTVSPTTGQGGAVVPGILRVNGSLASDVFVYSGGGLGGSGTVKSAWLSGGAWLGPGNSPGTLTIDGTLNMDTGSTYQVEVTPTGEHDSVIVTGNVIIADGVNLEVIAEPGSYPASTTHTILTTSGTISGSFDSIISDYAFLTPSLSADAKNIFLTLTENDTPFASYATTANQFAVATAAQTLGVGNPVFDAILPLAKDAVAPAFDQLSGEIYPSINTVIQQQSVYLRDAVSARLRQSASAPSHAGKAEGAEASPPAQAMAPTLWIQGHGGWGDSSGNGNAASISNNIGGVVAGIDVDLAHNVRAGIVGGYSHSEVDVDARNSSGSMNNYDIGLYTGGQFGSFALRGGLSHTWHDVSASREVTFPGFASQTKGDYALRTTQLFGEAGYDFDLGALDLEPFAGLTYLHISSGSFTESDAQNSGAALDVALASQNTLYSTLGIRAASSMTLGGHALTPSVTLGWQHAFDDTVSTATMALQGGSTQFQVAGVPIAENSLRLGAGLAYDISDSASFQVNYTGQFAGDVSQNAFNARFSLSF